MTEAEREGLARRQDAKGDAEALMTAASAPIPKDFIRGDDFIRDAFTLARRVVEGGCRPDAVLAVWRGGATVGAVVHEYFRYRGMSPCHGVIKAQSYSGIDVRGSPHVEIPEAMVDAIPEGGTVLVVDDILDSGRTMEAIVARLGRRAGRVVVATVYYKPARSETGRRPDFFVKETDRWLVFPHEIEGLTEAEIRAKDPALWDILADRPRPGVE